MKKQQSGFKVHKVIKSGFLLLTFNFIIFNSFAGGIQIPQQSIKSMSFGGAFTGFCGDASTVFYNPGGMNNLWGQHFTAGVMGLFPYVSLQTPSTFNVNQTSQAYYPIDFYWVGSFCDKLRVGFGVNNQFGSAASYPGTWEGQYIVQSIALKTYMFQPTVSYQICKQLSIGGGFVYTLGSFSDTKAIPVASSEYSNGEVTLDGTGHAFGYNFGLFSKIWQNGSDSSSSHQSLQLGVSYRSALNMTVPNGNVNFSQIPASLATQFPSAENFSTNVNLPAVFTAGFAFKFSFNKWNFMVTYDFNYTVWNTFDSLHFNFTNPNTPSQGFVYKWKNAMAHRFGAEAKFMKKYALRVGYYIDNTPVQNGYVSPEIVDANSSGFCFGAGVAFCKHYSVDISYLRSDFTWSNTTWNNPSGGVESSGGPDFAASYHRIINIFGIGINYKF